MPSTVQDKRLKYLTTIEEEKRPKNPSSLDKALKDSKETLNIKFYPLKTLEEPRKEVCTAYSYYHKSCSCPIK